MDWMGKGHGPAPLARGGHGIGKGQRRARSCAVVTGNVRTGTRSGEFRSRQAALG